MQEVVFLVATHEQAHALQIIEAAHVPKMEPQHVAAIESGAVASETAAPMSAVSIRPTVSRAGRCPPVVDEQGGWASTQLGLPVSRSPGRQAVVSRKGFPPQVSTFRRAPKVTPSSCFPLSFRRK